MRSYPLAEARAALSQLVDRALAGEPQSVTRRGRDAVVIVSERDWTTREGKQKAPVMPVGRPIETFADALVALGHAWNDVYEPGHEAEPVLVQTRPPEWISSRTTKSVMYLIDTDIASVLDGRRQDASPTLVAWLYRNSEAVHLSPITLLELEVGRLRLVRTSRDRRAAETRTLVEFVMRQFKDRLLSIDTDIALAAAMLSDRCRGEVVDIKDILIAATARVHRLTVLTRNPRHFRPTGVPAIDPFERLPPDA